MYHEKGGKSISVKNKTAAIWDKANTTRIALKLQNRTDADILAKLESVGNKQGYIKELIRQDIARTTSKDKEDKNMTKVINANGTEIDYNAAVALMDDDICAELNDKLAPCTEQEFFSAYEQAHEAKYGEEWEYSKANPCT